MFTKKDLFIGESHLTSVSFHPNRDIKLCNLMISSKDPLHTKMIDFGFMMDLNADANRTSSSISETVVTDTLVGTEGFFAPESITKCEYSRMTDLWQLGCVLYTMLVGYHPFSTQKRCIFGFLTLNLTQISS